MTARIYADFNNTDELSRVRFTGKTMEDLESFNLEFQIGMQVILYMEDIEVDAVIIFDEQWLGIPDWSNYRNIPYPD